MLSQHPDFNKSNLKWLESEKGIAWKNKGFDTLPWEDTLDGKGWNFPERPKVKHYSYSSKESSYTSNRRYDEDRDRRDYKRSKLEINNLLIHNDETLTMTYVTTQGDNKPLKVLCDTGAFGADYISKTLVVELKLAVNNHSNSLVVCSGLGDCKTCNGKIIDFKLLFFNEIINDTEEMTLELVTIDIPYDIIISKQTMRRYKLHQKCFKQLWNDHDEDMILNEKKT
jgi:hypothetical protein